MMFSSGEIFVVCLIALVVLGPDRLPGVMRRVVLFGRNVKSWFTDLRGQIEKELELEVKPTLPTTGSAVKASGLQ